MNHDNKNDAVYLWKYRGVATQANAAGGAIVFDITPGDGNYLELIAARPVNSGTNTLLVQVLDSANNNLGLLGTLGSAAGLQMHLPSIGANANATANVMNSTGLRVLGTDKLVFLQGAAGLQNDTLTVSIRAYVRSSTAPTVSKARSTNAADVTIVETYNTVTVA